MSYMKLQFVVVIAIFFGCFLMVKAGGCDVSKADLKRTTSSYGFTEAKSHGYSWFSCGEDYTFSSSFTAKNSEGASVSGVICCGVWKNCTLKF